MATVFWQCMHQLQGGKKSTFNTWEPAKQRQEWQTTVTAVFLSSDSWLRLHWNMEHVVIPELFQLMAPRLAPQESTKAVSGCKHMCPKGCLSCSSCYHILFRENISLFFFNFLGFYWSQCSHLQNSVLQWPWFLLCEGPPVALENYHPVYLIRLTPSFRHRPAKMMHTGEWNWPLLCHPPLQA